MESYFLFFLYSLTLTFMTLTLWGVEDAYSPWSLNFAMLLLFIICDVVFCIAGALLLFYKIKFKRGIKNGVD